MKSLMSFNYVFHELHGSNINSSISISALECGPPGRPAYGRHQNIAESESYKEGESVSYLCDSGYYMVGPIQRRCLPNGTWTGNMPVCGKNFYISIFIFHFQADLSMFQLIHY